MTTAGTKTILQRIFKGLKRETLAELDAFSQRNTYPPNTVLCKQGELEHTFYVILSGKVSATQTVAGEERLLAMLGPNEYFGEMGLLDDTPRMATCTTLTETSVLEITEAAFDYLVERSPAIAYTVTHSVLSSLRKQTRLTIQELQQKNKELRSAYKELQDAQASIIESERLHRELEIAADMQRRLLPTELPHYPDYLFGAYLQPARQVGGDFYDVIQLDEDHIGLLIADVADKGFHAALFMAVTLTLFRSESAISRSPSKVALAVHEGMLDAGSTQDTFVTAFYGILHRPSRRLRYVRAGHDRPLLNRAGKVMALGGNGRFLGMLPKLQLKEYELVLEKGDKLLLISDGIPDAVNRRNEQYGNGRLAHAFQHYGHLPIQRMVDSIAGDVEQWSHGTNPFDDVTMLAMEVTH